MRVHLLAFGQHGIAAASVEKKRVGVVVGGHCPATKFRVEKETLFRVDAPRNAAKEIVNGKNVRDVDEIEDSDGIRRRKRWR